ncbi:MAG: alpha-glucuronidase [Defluviitaleaceae bacterium]|nr:alpha-glucuronidase [Defluviitaleaceae bacterium]MCL2262416.1 alpha-glucuronidase [Defluviitaleaceae bacterium]
MRFGYKAWMLSEELKVESGEFFAEEEFRRGIVGFFGEEKFKASFDIDENLPLEGFSVAGGADGLKISGGCESGLLYGAYAALFALKRGEAAEKISISQKPAVEKRILNHWDNGDGSVERGYSGGSLFWRDGKIGYDLPRLRDYARLLASVGINEISVNNVNVRLQTAKLLTDEGLKDLVKVAEVFRPFGIRLIISVHFDSPVWLGGLKTSDPADPKVADFWNAAAARVYGKIPDLAGFLVKADSEFQSGPNAFGHTQDVGANVIAKALKPHGGTLYWRCFIYNCLQDWRDTVTDRPKAAYDTFFPLDGKFDQNVILQVKHGPSDFQVREPNSPLLGALKNTREALEFQIAQEYTGQQKDLYAWAVQWEEILDAPFNEERTTRDLIGKEIEAIVAVSNTGDDENWCGHLMAQANLFAFGRLAYNPALTAKAVTEEWVSLTFGNAAEIHAPIAKMLLDSRHVYEKYNAPLGICWMVCIHHHYGPSPDGYEYMKWGTYHRADTKAIGVDRTRNGTSYTAQYQPFVRDLYENLQTCPQEMLLYFHRLPYDFKLKDGRTMIQYIYDTHFEGVEGVENFITVWESLKGKIPDEAYTHVRERLAMQLENAKEWRDVINSYFYRKCGIPDEKGRTVYV